MLAVYCAMPPMAENWRRGAARAIGCGLWLALSSCAWGQEKIHLQPLTISAPKEGGKQREVIVFPAVDARASTMRCGMKRNGYKAEVGRIYCDREPKDWLGELILLGLNQSGFKIVTTQNAKSANPLRLQPTLKFLFVDDVEAGPNDDFYKIAADVHVVLRAESSSGLVAERSFYASERLPVFSAPLKKEEWPSAVREEVVAQATRRLAEDIVIAVVELADRYPEVGAVPVAAGTQP